MLPVLQCKSFIISYRIIDNPILTLANLNLTSQILYHPKHTVVHSGDGLFHYFTMSEVRIAGRILLLGRANKYSSPTVNNHHGDRYPKSWPILSSRI